MKKGPDEPLAGFAAGSNPPETGRDRSGSREVDRAAAEPGQPRRVLDHLIQPLPRRQNFLSDVLGCGSHVCFNPEIHGYFKSNLKSAGTLEPKDGGSVFVSGSLLILGS